MAQRGARSGGGTAHDGVDPARFVTAVEVAGKYLGAVELIGCVQVPDTLAQIGIAAVIGLLIGSAQAELADHVAQAGAVLLAGLVVFPAFAVGPGQR
ncbi:hypothetical protein G6F68_015177 [Rhizopus microsporus]|nr:hypothetical protein G6F68_015177 [Rhizopus microsporus]